MSDDNTTEVMPEAIAAELAILDAQPIAMPKGNFAPQTKWKPEYTKDIRRMLFLGLTHEAIAEALGVDDLTLRTWRKRMPELEQIFQETKQKAIEARLARILKAAEDPRNWRADAWWLAVMYPDKFSEHRVISVEASQTPTSDDLNKAMEILKLL